MFGLVEVIPRLDAVAPFRASATPTPVSRVPTPDPAGVMPRTRAGSLERPGPPSVNAGTCYTCSSAGGRPGTPARRHPEPPRNAMRSILAVSVASLLLATGAQAQVNAPAKGDPVEVKATGTPGKAAAEQTVHVTATVTAVDAAARTVTLKSASGEVETFKVGPEVKRFSEIAPGDVLVVDYRVGLALEFQPPGSEVVPPTATATGGRAEKDQAPGASASAGLKGTVTV